MLRHCVHCVGRSGGLAQKADIGHSHTCWARLHGPTGFGELSANLETLRPCFPASGNIWQTLDEFCEWVYFKMTLPQSQSRVISKTSTTTSLLYPKEPLGNCQREGIFRSILSLVSERYDNLFSCSFAYSMTCANHSRLMGCISLKTGSFEFELIAKLQHDIAPKQVADQLRAEPEVRYG